MTQAQAQSTLPAGDTVAGLTSDEVMEVKSFLFALRKMREERAGGKLEVKFERGRTTEYKLEQ